MQTSTCGRDITCESKKTLVQIHVKNPKGFVMILSLQETLKTLNDLLKFLESCKIIQELEKLEAYPKDLTPFS